MREKFDSLVEHLISSGFFLEEAVELLEKTLIQQVLERTKGNRSAASKILGIHRNTLQRKLAEYELETKRVRRKPTTSARLRQRSAKAG